MPACPTTSPATADGVIEPLLLPLPGDPYTECTGCGQPTEHERAILAPGTPGAPRLLQAPGEDHELIRYRWMIGHQAVFCVWRTLCGNMSALKAAHVPAYLQVHQAALGYDVYSLLLLYAGSCSSDQYAATVRRDMMDCHPAFSGTWARDHAGLPQLLHRVRQAHPGQPLADLLHAARLNRAVHMAIADSLVPQGASLLQAAGRRSCDAPAPEEFDLYDAFFHVRRRGICPDLFAAQVLRRFAQIVSDLSSRGLLLNQSRSLRLPGRYHDDIQVLAQRAESTLAEYAHIVQYRLQEPAS